MGMNTNPYTITTTMGGGGGQLIRDLQRAEDEKLNLEEKKNGTCSQINKRSIF
jgi:hypothetical protein